MYHFQFTNLKFYLLPLKKTSILHVNAFYLPKIFSFPQLFRIISSRVAPFLNGSKITLKSVTVIKIFQRRGRA